MNNTLLKTLGFIALILSSSVYANESKLTDVERAQLKYVEELEGYQYINRYGMKQSPILLKLNESIPIPDEFRDSIIYLNFSNINLLYSMLIHGYSTQKILLNNSSNTSEKDYMLIYINCNKLDLYKEMKSFYIANKNVIHSINKNLEEQGKPYRTYSKYIEDADKGIVETKKELEGKTCS